ncbi:MAG: ribosomal-protein-alanine N-acetyltransferase [Clostridiales bacterium]|nr:ribosomal-protein-alanine N-acetyltransferase [Clostridiales bacterium]
MNFKSLDSSFAKSIAEFFSKNFSDGWNEDMLLSAFSLREFFAVGAFFDDSLVGVVTFTFSIDTADIEDIVTDKNYRRKGIGKDLLKIAEHTIKEKSISKIFLEVRESNNPAIGLYTNAGYKRLSVRKKYYSDGENAVVMVKEI